MRRRAIALLLGAFVAACFWVVLLVVFEWFMVLWICVF